MLEPPGDFPFDAVGNFMGVVEKDVRIKDQMEFDVAGLSGFPGFKKVVAIGVAKGDFPLDDFPNGGDFFLGKTSIHEHGNGLAHDGERRIHDVR